MVYKYTADGRKVAIIGALNTKETIVQEVFVADGIEIPAGEHFVVKTLLDSPAITHKVREEQKLLASIEKYETECSRLKKELIDYRRKTTAAVAKLKWVEHISEPELREVFDNIKAMLCGEYTHVVFPGSEIVIKAWDHDLFTATDPYSSRFESLKMLSLFGDWNGRLGLNWKINNYSDGSGRSKQFIPCKSLQEAIEAGKAIIEAKPHLSDSDYKFCVQYGLQVDTVKNMARLASKSSHIQNQITENKKRLAKLEADLTEVS